MNSKQQLMGSSCISKVMWWQQHLSGWQCRGIAVNCKVSLFYIVVAHCWLCNSHFWKRSPWLSLLAKNGNSLAKYVSFIVSQHINCVAAAISEKAPGNPFMLKMTNIWLQNWVFLWQNRVLVALQQLNLGKKAPSGSLFPKLTNGKSQSTAEVAAAKMRLSTQHHGQCRESDGNGITLLGQQGERNLWQEGTFRCKSSWYIAALQQPFLGWIKRCCQK